MNDYCKRCGKRTTDIHTCTPNPVIQELRTLLKDWLVFAKDVRPGCHAGYEWLEGLRNRTEKEVENER